MVKIKKEFWSCVFIGTHDECWEWKLYKDKKYGKFMMGGKCKRAHRIAYELTYGIIPNGLHVLHTCNNPSCCNPNHLKLGTHLDNMNQMKNEKRYIIPRMKGENCGASKLNSFQVLRIRDLYSTGSYSQRELAKKYKVKQYCIFSIVHRKTWSHI